MVLELVFLVIYEPYWQHCPGYVMLCYVKWDNKVYLDLELNLLILTNWAFGGKLLGNNDPPTYHVLLIISGKNAQNAKKKDKSMVTLFTSLSSSQHSSCTLYRSILTFKPKPQFTRSKSQDSWQVVGSALILSSLKNSDIDVMFTKPW